MKSTHLTPALITILLIAALLTGSTQYAEWLENRYVHALAPKVFNQKYLGSALQRAAFRQPDLLPMYGSSELDVQKE